MMITLSRRVGSLAVTCSLLITLTYQTFYFPHHSAQRQTVSLIITGGVLVTMDADRRVIADGAVAIKDDRIVSVGTSSEIMPRYDAPIILDARGGAIIPGLINGHTHIPMTIFRGLGSDLDLNDWLTKFIFPAEAKNVTEGFVRLGTQLGLAEMIRGGTTTYCDMYYFEDAIAEETVKAGVRAVLGETVIDFPAADNKRPADALKYSERFIKKWHGNALITPAIAPHAPYTVSRENLLAIHSLSEQLKAPVIIHVAETQKEVSDIAKAHQGLRPVDYLARIGFLNQRVIAAHLVFVNEQEIATLKMSGVGAVHNPQSNMKLASGVAPVPQMLAMDLAVGLGTDGAASNNDLDMWEEMDSAAKLHKVFTRNPRILPAREAFEMATIRGARALKLEKEIGSIEVGKRADVVIVDLNTLHQTPRYDIYSSLVYSTKAADVQIVIINGRIVMRDRELLTLDEEVIKQRARNARDHVRESLENAVPN